MSYVSHMLLRFVDRVDRKAEAARDRLRAMAPHDKAKRLLLFFGQRPEAFVYARAHLP